MGELEHHQLIGKASLELKATRERMGALRAKASVYAQIMRIVSQNISPVAITYGPGASLFTMDSIDQTFSNYPDRADVLALREEIAETGRRIEQLTKSLQEMGGVV